MSPKACKALCLLVHFLINKSHGYRCSFLVPNYPFCCVAITTPGNNSSGKTEQAQSLLSNLCEGIQKLSGNIVNQTENDNGSTEKIPTVLHGETQNTNPKEAQTVHPTREPILKLLFNAVIILTDNNRTCWHVEIKSKNCNEGQTTTTSCGIKDNNGKDKSQKKKDKDYKSFVVSFTGAIVGAVLGGAVFGSVITMIVFLCFCRAFFSHKIRNSDCKPRSFENLQETVRPVDNETVYNEINDQAVIRLQPMRRPESANVSPREETYSHLHESDKEDMNESYDHARQGPSCCVRENRYEVLTRVGNNNRDATDVVPSKIPSDNYFIIEPQ